VIRGSGIERNMAEISISNIRDLSSYKVVTIEGNGAIGYGVVPEDTVRLRWISRDDVKNEGDSGRAIFMPWGSSVSWTLLNNQSLAANSPTRTTY
jgi:hypothetical protein